MPTRLVAGVDDPATSGGLNLKAIGPADVASGTAPTAAGQVLTATGASPFAASWQALPAGNAGTVTSVAMSMPTLAGTDQPYTQGAVGGSPITSSGTLAPALATVPVSTFFACPLGAAGNPRMRTIAPADLAVGNSFRSEHYCGTVGSTSLANAATINFSASNQAGGYNALAPRMIYAGSVIGISAFIVTGAVQGVTIDAIKNGATFSATSGTFNGATSGVYFSILFAKGAFPFAANDTLGAQLKNVAGSTITTLNGYCYLWIECAS